MKKQQKRNLSMDIARGLAVIAVVVGHSGTPFRSFLYLFHIPLFFFISGYFYKDTYTDKPLVFIKKRIKSLYVPFVLWELAFLFLHNPFYQLNIYNVAYGGHTQMYTMQDFIFRIQRILTFNSTEELAGIFWFFTVLFEISVLFALISYVLNNYLPKHAELSRFAIISGMFLLGGLLSMIALKLPNKFDVVFTVSLFYYLGYLYQRFEHVIPYRLFYFLLGNVLLFVASFAGDIEPVQNVFPNLFFLLLTSIVGIYCTFHLAQVLENHAKISNMLSFIGRNSISILALHLLAFKTIHLIQIAVYKHPPVYLASFPVLNGTHGWWVLYSLAGLLLPVAVISVFRGNLLKHLIKN